MNTHIDKIQENKSHLTANSDTPKQSGSESAFQFVDNRPEAVTQRKLQGIANSSLPAKHTVQLQTQTDNNFVQEQQSLPKQENKTGLPDNLKSGIENLSGYSMDDVKVHRNSNKPAQLNALAYAQGTDIHLASGQEKHLPHEAWHVVQQKQGRVKPTMQMKGKVNVNDDAGLEKEADVMGSKAQTLQLKWVTPKAPSALGNAVVQRAIAIEAESFQTWKVSGKREGYPSYRPIKDTKNALGSKGKIELTSDNGNLEYVTGTLANEGEVEAAFGQMMGTLNALAAASSVEIDSLPKEEAGLDWTSQSAYQQYRLTAPSRAAGLAENAAFLPQATIDIPFGSFDAYIKKFKNKDNAHLMGRAFTNTAKYVDQTPLGMYMSLGMFSSLHPASTGFLKMVLMALHDAWAFPGGEDPKYAFATMPRNRFSEMYTAANEASGDNLASVFPTFVEQVAKMREDNRIPNLFTQKYKGDDGNLQGPTVQEWFDSITVPEFMLDDYAEGEIGARESDLLSPPHGQRSKREGLGAYDLAGGTVPFFELRDFISSQSSRQTWKLPDICKATKDLLKIEKTLR